MKAKIVSITIDQVSEQQLADSEVGWSMTMLNRIDHRHFSRRLTSLINEEMNRALQAMRAHAEACRLPAKKGRG